MRHSVLAAREGFFRDGYCLLPRFFPAETLAALRSWIDEAQAAWEREHEKHLSDGVINSAYLTASRFWSSEARRNRLFGFIAAPALVGLAEQLMEGRPYFMNTQLFFNPRSAGRGKEKRPYWHRDVQYHDLLEAEQQALIFKDQVLHCRIPLEPDPGMEFIPGSHRRWDTPEERRVRLELDGRRNFESLPGAVRIPHEPGDLLVFSAHLIHKGVYAGNRRSLDILYASFPQGESVLREHKHFPVGAPLEQAFYPEIFASVGDADADERL